MRSPFLIGVLSVIPGLGLLLMREFKAALLVWSILILCASISLTSSAAPLRTLTIWSAATVWVGQAIYAIFTTRKGGQAGDRTRLGEGEHPSPRSAVWRRPSPSEISTESIVAPLLRPDERLLVSTLGMDAPPGSLNSRQYAIGVTPDYLITVELAIWGLPGELKRTPLEKIAVARFSQATLVDHVELHIAGREMPMSFFFYPICRPLVSQIVEALRSGADAHGLGGSAVP